MSADCYETATIHPVVEVRLSHMPHNWGASVPSIPGCVATGRTREQVLSNIREALEMHLAALAEEEFAYQVREETKAIPEARTS